MQPKMTDLAASAAASRSVPADAPILIFDSGVGGLSVLDTVRAALPDAPLIYAADTAGLPYGSKSEAEIAARVAGLLGRMSERFRQRLACIACNTASTIALGMVRDVLHLPIVGTVPAIKPAAERTKTGAIGLIGTEATIRQAYVDKLEAEFAGGKTLLRLAAPDLVAAAEAKLRGEPVDVAAIRKAATDLARMADGKVIDVLVLACTHFPLLSDELHAAFGPDVALVDGAEGIARRIVHLTQGQPFARSRPDRAVFTGDDGRLDALRPALAARGIEDVALL